MKTHIRSHSPALRFRWPAFMSLLRRVALSLLAVVPLQQVNAQAPFPTVTSPTATGITLSGATLGGNVTSDGGNAIAERGVVYSVTTTNSNPQIGDAGVTHQSASGTTGVFTTTISSSLTGSTQYSYKAYARNSAGTVYSPIGTFTTLAGTPTVDNPTKTSITDTTATLGGRVLHANGSTITERGVVYSATATNNNPTIGGTGVTKIAGTLGAGTGVFTVNVTGLVLSTGYSLRAYAISDQGTSYSWVSTFTTTPTTPSVTSPTVASIANTTATLGGNVTSMNGAAITERGVVYSATATNANPIIGGTGVTAIAGTLGTGTGVFTVDVSGLVLSTGYSFAAYATNSMGTSYSWVNTFTTLPTVPTVTSPTRTSITTTGATLGGTVVSDNNAAITERGVVYSATNADPVINGTGVTKVAGTLGTGTGVFAVPITGMVLSTRYYFKAYAINSRGPSYSSLSTVTTLPTAPTVISSTSASITATTATLGGNVTSDNAASITARGVVYSVSATNNNPTMGGLGVTAVAGTGTTGGFTVPVTGLTPGATYSYRAYATNSKGTSYSFIASFLTLPAPPTVNTPTSASITTTGVTLGGDVVSANGSAITERGVVYSITATNNNPALLGPGVTPVSTTGTTGVFTVDITGLAPGTVYSFKAYATNGLGTSYSSVSTFTTLPTLPSVAAPTSASITDATAELGGNVTNANDVTLQRGVVYSVTATNANPEIGGTGVMNVPTTGSTGIFTVGVANLLPFTQYSFAAYATNTVGTAYTSVVTFSTPPAPPTVTTPASTLVTTTGATLGGDVTLENGDPVTERGVLFSIRSANNNPMYDDDPLVTTVVPEGSGLGAFTQAATGLAVGTEYAFKAYAINGAGTGYSDVSFFTTVAFTPTISNTATAPLIGITTDPLTAISSATVKGTVTLSGAEFIERGVVYSLGTDNTSPVIGGTKVTQKISSNNDGLTIGEFSISLTDLLPGKQYYFRAYVKNATDTAYSLVANFLTPAVAPLIQSTPTSGSITATGATLGGEVIHTGGKILTEVGVVYSSTISDPLLTDSTAVTKKANATVQTGAVTTGAFTFTKAVTLLQPATRYYFKAFAKSAAGTSYSSVGTFTTLAVIPTLTLPTKTSISGTSATLGGTVSSDGGNAIRARGVVYSISATNANPMLLGTGVTAVTTTGTTGALAVPVTGLVPNTTYSYKAYATNGVGTGYAVVGTFTTLTDKPSVTTPTSTALTTTTAMLGGNVTDDNGAAITERGVVYSLFTANTNPQIGVTGVTKVTTTAATGIFTIPVTGLTTGKKYVFKAYAINGNGTTYSAVADFTTVGSAPTIASPTKATVLGTKAILGGNVTKDNGAAITERGVVYSKTSANSNPQIGGSGVTKSAAATASIGVFTVTVTGLTPGTAYSFRAYATNSKGTTYTTGVTAPVSTFTTPAEKPTVTSPTSALVASTTARLGGNVTNDNGADITERGVVYSFTNVKPSLDTSKKKTASGTTGELDVGLTGLLPAKKYYYRAYAKNSKGTGYSAVGTFTTDPDAPSIRSTPTKTNITISSAKIGGSGIKANGSAITERGVVYSSTDSNPRIGDTGVIQKTSASTMSSFGIIIKGLAAGTEYSFRAYAKNAIGTTYTDVGTFTTLGSSAMVLAGSPAGTILGGASASAADTTETYYTIDPATGLQYLTIVINKAAGTESQPRTVEVSGNLTEWFSGSSHTTVVSDDAGVLKVRDNTPVTADVKRYIRLK